MWNLVRCCSVAIALGVVLVAANGASAGPILDWFGFGAYDHCPTPNYSPLNYWAPVVPKVYDRVRGPKIPVYPPDRHPEIAPDCTILPFCCPPVAPANTFIPVPTPPADSKFHY
jgi:hypothetical protein